MSVHDTGKLALFSLKTLYYSHSATIHINTPFQIRLVPWHVLEEMPSLGGFFLFIKRLKVLSSSHLSRIQNPYQLSYLISELIEKFVANWKFQSTTKWMWNLLHVSPSSTEKNEDWVKKQFLRQKYFRIFVSIFFSVNYRIFCFVTVLNLTAYLWMDLFSSF